MLYCLNTKCFLGYHHDDFMANGKLEHTNVGKNAWVFILICWDFNTPHVLEPTYLSLIASIKSVKVSQQLCLNFTVFFGNHFFIREETVIFIKVKESI